MVERPYRIAARSSGVQGCAEADSIVFARAISDQSNLCTDAAEFLSKHKGYGGLGSFTYGLRLNGRMVAFCCFWDNNRFKETVWDLVPGQAIMCQLVTDPAFRGQRLAPALMNSAAERLIALGFHNLLAWVWHSNLPSVGAFEAAGWELIALVFETRLLGLLPARRVIWRRGVVGRAILAALRKPRKAE
jgi:ribosomal protein S18 acetylase RimI-like enzyme